MCPTPLLHVHTPQIIVNSRGPRLQLSREPSHGNVFRQQFRRQPAADHAVAAHDEHRVDAHVSTRKKLDSARFEFLLCFLNFSSFCEFDVFSCGSGPLSRHRRKACLFPEHATKMMTKMDSLLCVSLFSLCFFSSLPSRCLLLSLPLLLTSFSSLCFFCISVFLSSRDFRAVQPSEFQRRGGRRRKREARETQKVCRFFSRANHTIAMQESRGVSLLKELQRTAAVPSFNVGERERKKKKKRGRRRREGKERREEKRTKEEERRKERRREEKNGGESNAGKPKSFD